MPFFAYAPPPPPKKPLHHKKQADPKKQQTSSTAARTLLPMTGGTPGRTTTTATPPTTTQVATTQGPVSTGTGQTVAPIKILIPNDSQNSAGAGSGLTKGTTTSNSKNKLKFVEGLYFDAGAEDLIGTFTTLVARAGVRYNDDELDVYFRNETLDTRGTNLPFQSVIAGASAGVAYRHYFLKDHVFFTASDGSYFSGPNSGKGDFRLGLVGQFDWRNEKVFTDIYTDLFYIDLVKDTILTGRIRSGVIVLKNKTGQVIGYGVAQMFASGSGSEGTENRVEAGFGVGYIFQGHISLNVELRAGYAYRGLIDNRAYLNPMIVLSGGF